MDKYGKYPDIKEKSSLGLDSLCHFLTKEIPNQSIHSVGNNELCNQTNTVCWYAPHGTFSDKISISKENLILVPDYLTNEEAATTLAG